MGITPISDVLQIGVMDDALRHGLWSVLTVNCWERLHGEEAYLAVKQVTGSSELLQNIWMKFLKQPVDDVLYTSCHDAVEYLKQQFYQWPWNRVYDFIEFVAKNYPVGEAYGYVHRVLFLRALQDVLEREHSGYRFVDFDLVPITSEQELEAIRTALAAAQASKPLAPIAFHLKKAVSALADRKEPNFRDSMKESISAVEAMCKLVAGDPTGNDTLGSALKKIQSANVVNMHHSLRDAFQKLYGYTNDAEGIRHALKDDPTVDVENATFMLVTCSAFVNYLVAKAAKAGIDLSKP
jgi:AbiJ N-terminal domain 4